MPAEQSEFKRCSPISHSCSFQLRLLNISIINIQWYVKYRPTAYMFAGCAHNSNTCANIVLGLYYGHLDLWSKAMKLKKREEE